MFAIAAALAKVLGSGLPALTVGFNRIGALRIGAGTMPRGEVALIVAAVVVATGILSDQVFGVSVAMVLVTTVLGTPLFASVIARPERRTKRVARVHSETTSLRLPSEDLTRLVLNSVLQAFRTESFYLNRMDLEPVVYQLRKERVFLSLTVHEGGLTFSSDPEDVIFIKTMLYESLLALNETVTHLKDLTRPERLKREAVSSPSVRTHYPVDRYLDPRCIELNRGGHVQDTARLVHYVLERERSLSTGMSDGISILHARSDAVDEVCFAIGVKREGVKFGSLDGEPARIFILIASPGHSPGPPPLAPCHPGRTAETGVAPLRQYSRRVPRRATGRPRRIYARQDPGTHTTAQLSARHAGLTARTCRGEGESR